MGKPQAGICLKVEENATETGQYQPIPALFWYSFIRHLPWPWADAGYWAKRTTIWGRRFFAILTPALEPQIRLHMRCYPKKAPFQISFSAISKKTGICLQWGQHVLQRQEVKRVLYFMPKMCALPMKFRSDAGLLLSPVSVRGSNGRRWIFCVLWIPERDSVVSIKSINCPNIC